MDVPMNRASAVWAATMAYASVLMWLAIANVPSRLDAGSAFQLDKLWHAGAYMLLAVLVARTLWLSAPGGSRGLVAACAIATAMGYAMITERMQATVSWRTSEGFDAAANAAGVLAGVFAWSRLEAKESRRRQRG